MKCQRCGKETKVHTMSRFNTQDICMECKDKEMKHPKYKEACDREHQEVVNGNMNYEGIGLPEDLE